MLAIAYDLEWRSSDTCFRLILTRRTVSVQRPAFRPDLMEAQGLGVL